MEKYINEIICGDNVEVLREFPDESIDLTVTSPPYDNLRTYNGFEWDFEGLAQELYRVTKDGGVVVWVVNDATVNGSETGTSFKQALYFKDVGFNIHDTMIWRKTNPIPNDPRQNQYIQCFEYMFVFSNGSPSTCNYLMEESKLAGVVAGQGTARRPDGSVRIDRVEKRRGSQVNKLKPLSNIWDISTSTERDISHPAMYPNRVASNHIVSWSNPGDIVLDPFIGSGTTAKMAVLNDRKYIGIDISEEYCNLARKRVSEAIN